MHLTEGGTHWALSLDDNSTTQMGPLLLFLPKKNIQHYCFERQYKSISNLKQTYEKWQNKNTSI